MHECSRASVPPGSGEMLPLPSCLPPLAHALGQVRAWLCPVAEPSFTLPKSWGWGCTSAFSPEQRWVPAQSCATRGPASALGYSGGGGFKGRVLLPLSCPLPSCLQHAAACPDCRGCPMPGAGSCGLLPPAVTLLLSNVTSSRAWTELEGEGGGTNGSLSHPGERWRSPVFAL